MDRGAWWATVNRVAQIQIRLKQLTMHARSYLMKRDTNVGLLDSTILCQMKTHLKKSTVNTTLYINLALVCLLTLTLIFMPYFISFKKRGKIKPFFVYC